MATATKSRPKNHTKSVKPDGVRILLTPVPKKVERKSPLPPAPSALTQPFGYIIQHKDGSFEGTDMGGCEGLYFYNFFRTLGAAHAAAHVCELKEGTYTVVPLFTGPQVRTGSKVIGWQQGCGEESRVISVHDVGCKLEWLPGNTSDGESPYLCLWENMQLCLDANGNVENMDDAAKE